jgi:L-fucono-1,5-lactonase
VRLATPGGRRIATRIDAHQHFWRLGDGGYSWLTGGDYGPIQRDFGPDELRSLLDAAGIERSITVQADNTFADTDEMLGHAQARPWVAAVTGWVPLLDPAACERALARYLVHPAFRGVRHLVHDEADPDWLLRGSVLESLGLLSERGLVFEIPAVFPRHLVHIPRLARRFPDLKIVIDHLGKPPIGDSGSSWDEQIAACAKHPNVYAKVSGLNTVLRTERWTAEHLRPYFETALVAFGAERLMFGSDWPVCLMNGDYEKVWRETLRLVHTRPVDEQDALLGGTAARVYGL